MQYGPGFVPSPSSAFAPTDRGSILAGLRRSGPLASAPNRYDYTSPQLSAAVYPGTGGQQYGSGGSYAQTAYNEQMEMSSAMQQLRIQTSAEFEKLAQRQAEIASMMQQQHGGPPMWSPPGQHSQYAGGYQGYAQSDAYDYQPYDSPHRSFGAAAIESALARNRDTNSPSYGFGYDAMSTPPIGTPRSNGLGYHHPHESYGSSGSILGAPGGPALVLSKPGETYPPVDLRQHGKRDSGSSSGGSESFDSAATTVSTGSHFDPLKLNGGVTSPTLNPGAIAFNPAAAAFSPKTSTTPTPSAAPAQRQRVPLALASRRAVQQGTPTVTITRQPRGAIAVDEPEFAAQNFTARRRVESRAGLNVLGRRLNSPIHDSSLEAQQQAAFSHMQQHQQQIRQPVFA